MTAVLLALGSNLGGRAGNLRAAIRLLGERGVRVARASSVWETAPVPAEQPAFLNAAVAAETDLGPVELLGVAKEVERLLGRRPGPRWGPRPIDIDVLFYGGETVAQPELTIPHPLVAERAFVLAPLSEVHAGPLPVIERTALELLAGVVASGLRRTGEPLP
jgi:2-amino-4-hydroxy-6-hydroxymethyldihydropteridine diphosphokinase